MNIADYIINTVPLGGRFANHFIRNLYLHIISKKYNNKIIYGFYNEIKQLGIELYTEGINQNFSHTIFISDDNFWVDIINI